ncbi:hypothetical protein [Parabacteroides sp.]|jgi:hypothetical protein|uniref:hypothetical protein n=1 Tax=Parabacteroides sp. TaxID=1869337 RepID=UPI00308039AB
MTTKERKEFDAFKRKLQEDPVFRISFFGDLRMNMDNVGDVMERMHLQNEAENKLICQHLGISYRIEDFEVSDEGLAEEWAKGLPDA